MCHLLLLMPLIALPVSWVWPLPLVGSTYAIVFVASLWLYHLTLRAMQRPVETGTDALLGHGGEVIGHAGNLVRVRVDGEIWTAKSEEPLKEGEGIYVSGLEGTHLLVHPRTRRSK